MPSPEELEDEEVVSPELDEELEVEPSPLLLDEPEELELLEPGFGVGPPLLHPCRASAPDASRIKARFFKVSLL